MYCNFVNTLFSRHERRSSMTDVTWRHVTKYRKLLLLFFLFVYFILLPLLVLLLLVKTKPLGRCSWTHLSLFFYYFIPSLYFLKHKPRRYTCKKSNDAESVRRYSEAPLHTCTIPHSNCAPKCDRRLASDPYHSHPNVITLTITTPRVF